MLYVRHTRFIRKMHTTYYTSSDKAKAGAELSGYHKTSEHVSGKVRYARHPRFLRKTYTTNYRKSSDNARAGAELSGKS